MKYTEIGLTDNKEKGSFEMTVGHNKAFIDYQKKDDIYYLLHTEVAEELRGQGAAEAVVEKTFQHLENHSYKIVPLCSYIQVYLKRHPQWNRIVKD